jgi:Major Facilitator Superfamily
VIRLFALPRTMSGGMSHIGDRCSARDPVKMAVALSEKAWLASRQADLTEPATINEESTMTVQPTPKGAWKITFLLFLFMLVNFADKIVVGLAGVPIMTEMNLEPESFGLLGSSFFFLFSIAAIIVGFIVNRVDTRWVLLALALIWALAQFPMVGTIGFTTLLICRVILGAGEGPAASVAAHAIFKWFPDEKRTLPIAILSQGSAFGVILAVPALNWVIVNYSWHYAFGGLGVVGLMWAVAWLILGKEGPLVPTAAMAANEPRIPYFQLLTSRTFVGCVAATFGAYWALSLGLTWFTPMGVRRRDRAAHRLDIAADAGARLHHPRRARRARFGTADRRRIGPRRASLCRARRTDDRPAGGRVGIVRIDLCGLRADARRVHAGVAARRHHLDLWSALYARRSPRTLCDGQRDPERGGAARRLYDGLHHQRGDPGRLGVARAAAAVAEHRARAVDGSGGAAEVCVRGLWSSRRRPGP